MIRVNLLPHRQIKREARQREFKLMSVFIGIAAAAILFLAYTYVSNQIERQLERNRRLDDGITKVDKEIADIKDLKAQITAMLERKQVVENLQTNRSQAVVVFDELSRQLPDGMFYTKIKQEGNVINIEGVADTNARVATLVRNLSTSQWMESPVLIEIKSVATNSQKQNIFTMRVNLKTPQLESEEADAKKAADGKQS